MQHSTTAPRRDWRRAVFYVCVVLATAWVTYTVVSVLASTTASAIYR